MNIEGARPGIGLAVALPLLLFASTGCGGTPEASSPDGGRDGEVNDAAGNGDASPDAGSPGDGGGADRGASYDEHVVEVIGGTGSGVYHEGERVEIEATSLSRKVFVEWEGDVSVLEDPRRSEAAFSMPARDIRLKAAHEPDCLTGRFEGPTGVLETHAVPVEKMGRLTLGDLDSDGHPDFVVANRNRLTAYDVCRNVLWRREVATNFDYERHYFWNWTSYGYIGDADGDGQGEYLHIGNDWRTVYVRDGLTGETKEEIALPEGQWMYVLLAQRPGESGETATRIIATSVAYYQAVRVEAYDIRDGGVTKEWSYHGPRSRVGNFAYIPPATVDLDGEGGDEVVFASVALDREGREIWVFNASGIGFGGLHTLSVRELDPSTEGLEAVYSVYGPRDGQPSLLSYSYSSRPGEDWRAYSPHGDKHPHQHTVGDFNLDSPGRETVARNGNGFDHWMVNMQGTVIRRHMRVDPGWSGDGEIVNAVEWDAEPGTDLLYIERHVARHMMPRLRVTSPHSDETLTPIFGGGDGSPIGWYGITREDDDNGPYEGAAHPVDVFGDGREEIVTWGRNHIYIHYNSGDADVPRQWGDADYMKRKKLWCNVYNPR